jgi:hypothetical protein
MKDKNNSDINSTLFMITTNQVGFYSAILTTLITMITFKFTCILERSKKMSGETVGYTFSFFLLFTFFIESKAI